MNTEKELQEAFKELDEGSFIKGKQPGQVEEDFYKD